MKRVAASFDNAGCPMVKRENMDALAAAGVTVKRDGQRMGILFGSYNFEGPIVKKGFMW